MKLPSDPIGPRIPFNRPWFSGHEAAYVAEAFANGHCAGDGPFGKRCEAMLEEMLGVRRVLLTTSCTHALELAAVLLDLQVGDEVIVPSFTFVSTAGAFALHGARIVFCDVREDTLNLDEALLPSLITERTRAIVPVHYAGIGCNMETIESIAEQRHLQVIEDNAHGIMGCYRGRPLGSFGSLATLSFHETKNVISGEGGALIINDPSYEERALVLREKGTDRNRFLRGEVDKYTWTDTGSSWALSDILAAVLYAQLEHKQRILAERSRTWYRYYDALKDWASVTGARLPVIPPFCEQSFHMFYLLMPAPEARDALLAHLRRQGIRAVFHYQPLHLSDMGRYFGGAEGMCPVTEGVSRTLLRLPLYTAMPESEQQAVIAGVLSFSG